MKTALIFRRGRLKEAIAFFFGGRGVLPEAFNWMLMGIWETVNSLSQMSKRCG